MGSLEWPMIQTIASLSYIVCMCTSYQPRSRVGSNISVSVHVRNIVSFSDHLSITLYIVHLQCPHNPLPQMG